PRNTHMPRLTPIHHLKISLVSSARRIAFVFFGVLQCFAATAQEGTFVPEATASIAFLYDSVEACVTVNLEKPTVPLGTGFFVGVPVRQKTQTPVAGRYPVVKVLFTTNHVVGDRLSLVVRVNRIDRPEFSCFLLPLKRAAPARNTFLPD